MGCYGQTKIKTPNLDKLAAEGMRFTSFYAGSTVCAPSRCALMTGLHTGHALIRGNALVALRPQDLTVAELLKQAGYHTALIGKWGLGNENTTGVPQKKGFDEFLGYLDQVHAHDYYTDHLWRYDPPTDAKPGYDGRVDFPENRDGKKGIYMHDLFTTAALNFRAHQQARPVQSLPALLPLPRLHHSPREQRGRPAHRQRHAGAQRRPLFRPALAADRKEQGGHDHPPGHRRRPAHGQAQALKIDDNTVVFFTSDNGPHKEGGVDPNFFQSGGPLRGIKRDLYEGGIRVPLIVRWPGQIKPGTVNDQPWAFWDFLPTAAEIAGAKVPEKLDGISMLPTLLGQPQTNQHDFLYWEFHERGFQQAVRMGDWKAVRLKPGGPLELYNLSTDLGEKQNVAAQNPEVVAKIEEYLKTARTESEQWPIKAAEAPPEKKQPEK